MPSDVLAVLTAPTERAADPVYRFVDPATAIVTVADLGVSRGDGVFETIAVNRGRAQSLEAHLARLHRSASMLELPEPALDAWRETVVAVAQRLPGNRECFVKLVLTRGPQGAEHPTGWVLGSISPDHRTARRVGIDVAVLDRGLRHDVAATSPWLLQGAKTLSYAVNMAAQREARRRGADDVLFVSSDGWLLEGATSTLLLKRGDRLVTPSTSLGILAGTTQADAFRFARGTGMTTAYEMLPVAALHEADALWLVSSVRNAAPVRSVDGEPRPIDADFTERLNAFLIERAE